MNVDMVVLLNILRIDDPVSLVSIQHDTKVM